MKLKLHADMSSLLKQAMGLNYLSVSTGGLWILKIKSRDPVGKNPPIPLKGGETRILPLLGGG